MALLAVLAIAGGAAGTFVVMGDDDSPSASVDTTVPAPTTPSGVFEVAAGSLEDAGHFGYRFSGRWELDPFGDGETEVITEDGTGVVQLPGQVQHTVTANDGSRHDLIIVGEQSWGRSSAFPDQIEQRPWADFDILAGLSGGGFNPSDVLEWLQVATDHRDGGEDPDGRTVVHGVLAPSAIPPAALDLGPSDDEQTLTSEVQLTVDEQHRPHQVKVAATTQSAVVELVFDAIDTATEATVERPAAGQIDRTPFVNEEDITAVQGAETLGLAGVPEGWILIGGIVAPDPANADCAQVELTYMGLGAEVDPAAPLNNFIFLHMRPQACETDLPPLDDPDFVAGEYEGVAFESEEGNFGAVQAGDLVVTFGTNLSLADLEIVLATLGPVDLTAEPESIEGIPSQPA